MKVLLVMAVAERDESVATRLRALARAYDVQVVTRGVGKGASRRFRADARDADLALAVVTEEGLVKAAQDRFRALERTGCRTLVLAQRGVPRPEAAPPYWFTVRFGKHAGGLAASDVDHALERWMDAGKRDVVAALCSVVHAMLVMGEVTLRA